MKNIESVEEETYINELLNKTKEFSLMGEIIYYG